jgi:hypothetical protein
MCVRAADRYKNVGNVFGVVPFDYHIKTAIQQMTLFLPYWPIIGMRYSNHHKSQEPKLTKGEGYFM